jgi:hypothetical protein
VTIGIAASGPNAGLAIIRALQAVERVAEGALGGFVSLAAIGADGAVHRAGIQRGGMAALFPAEVPAAIACAPRAAIISSGPERPEPLSQFVAADGTVGLVTGHRFPHQPGQDGAPLNEAVLAALRRGLSPAKAVRQVLSANPLADAGVIALDRTGRMAFGNTALVGQRPDVETARLPGIMVLLNSIAPGRAAVMLAAETAQVTMRPVRPDLTVILRRGIPIESGAAARLEIGSDHVVCRIVAPSFRAQAERQDFGFGYRVPVWQHGALIGRTLSEPYLVACRDALESVDGIAEQKLTLIAPDGAQQNAANRRAVWS